MERKISIVTPTYNCEQTLKDSLESILKQNYNNYEYIIVDGGSTDSTLQIIEEYKEKFSGRLTYISEKDNGIYDAMNKGILMATGEIISILNADDWYEDNVLNIVNDYAINYPDIGVFYGYIRIIKGGEEYMVRRNNYKFIDDYSGLIQHPTCFIKSEVYKNHGLYNCDYKIMSDLDFLLKIIKKGVKYKAIDRIITNFRVGGASSKSDNSLEKAKIKYINGDLKRLRYFRSYMFFYMKRFTKTIFKE